MPDGRPPRRVEGEQEFIRECCAQLGCMWQAVAAGEIRDSKAKRRAFVRVALDLAKLLYPDENDYQKLDEWIESPSGASDYDATVAGCD